MNFETSELFSKQLKKLAKKYKNIKKDLLEFMNDFDEIHQKAISIKTNIFKVRVKNSDKNKGKSAGYRIYYYLKINEKVFLLTIYDKSEIEMINEEILNKMIKDFK
jgi:mRNA-degrading endonuclease RelE of RelBE toxin-antitoxin system